MLSRVYLCYYLTVGYEISHDRVIRGMGDYSFNPLIADIYSCFSFLTGLVCLEYLVQYFGIDQTDLLEHIFFRYRISSNKCRASH